jgi:CzcA family heavy metal efflux pump
VSLRHALGGLATRNSAAIIFLSLALCVAGVWAALTLPSSVFPQTDFPRVIVLVDNGVMPADEMMATITRPIEEAMKDIPGAVKVRSATGRGSAEVNIFFSWGTDMVRAELFVLGRLAEIRSSLPPTAVTEVHRFTFSVFPIIGISLTSPTRDLTHLWDSAQYDLKPRFLRIPGVARVDLVGGRAPELHVIVDPVRLLAAHLSLADVNDALARDNIVTSTGMLEENHTLYLTVLDGRVRTPAEVERMTIAVVDGRPVRIGDVAHVERGPEPVFNVVTAQGVEAVLLMVQAQPDGSTLDIAKALKAKLAELRRELPPDMKLTFFYDQSLLVRDSVNSVWEAILFGLLLSVAIIYLFLKDWGTTWVATLVIPVAVLVALVAMKAAHMSFNLMTLGGIAAAIGLVIDDAIVVVEAIHTALAAGAGRRTAVQRAIEEILPPLTGSTLTPVVVFLPLAFLDGVSGVFFRALALTMVVALLSSLALAVTLTPSLAVWLSPRRERDDADTAEEGGAVLARVRWAYEKAVRAALAHRWMTLAACGLLLAAGLGVTLRLKSEFLPPMDEGGFIVDYVAPPGTSLTETNRQMLVAESIIRKLPEVESYSRRTGAQLGLAITEPNTGDFLIKLKSNRTRTTDEVIANLRHDLTAALPDVQWEFPGILTDLIGDLQGAPQPIEIRLFSPDVAVLKQKAPEVAARIAKVPGVVDVFDGLVYAGATLTLRLREADARRFGLTGEDVAAAVDTAMLGQTPSTVLQGDRVLAVRVRVDSSRVARIGALADLPLRAADGSVIRLSQVADIAEEPGQLELHRDDLRQDVAVTARLEGRDLGSAMAEITRVLAADPALPAGMVEYGGLYEQQQESFRNLLGVLGMAIVLVFTVLLLEFRSFREPVSIVFGAVLALFGTVLALWITGTSLNVVSFLGAIIGVGIVAKNGILMLDFVGRLLADGLSLVEALVRSGRRRLRPVLMTSLAAALGMLPLAYGVGSGADMLRPLAIAVIGALCISVLLSLVATPTVYLLLAPRTSREPAAE